MATMLTTSWKPLGTITRYSNKLWFDCEARYTQSSASTANVKNIQTRLRVHINGGGTEHLTNSGPHIRLKTHIYRNLNSSNSRENDITVDIPYDGYDKYFPETDEGAANKQWTVSSTDDVWSWSGTTYFWFEDVSTSSPRSNYKYDDYGDSDDFGLGPPAGETYKEYTLTTTINLPTVYKLSVASDNTKYGTVSGGGYFNSGASTTITASPEQGYEFEKWSDEDTSNPREILVDSSKTLKAIFHVDSCTLTLNQNISEAGTVSGEGTFNYNTPCTAIAETTNIDYDFVGWYEGQTELTSNLTYSFSLKSDRTLTANWIIKTYTVSLDSTDYGTVTGAGTYNSGTTATITATEEPMGYFLGWYDSNDNFISDNKVLTFVVRDNYSYKAKFILINQWKTSKIAD